MHIRSTMISDHYFSLIQPLLAEFFAMFLHTFWGSMWTPHTNFSRSFSPEEASLETNYLVTAVVPALQAAFAVYMIMVLFWKVCLIHFNPAMSLAFAITGKLSWKLLIPYIFMQLLGSVFAAWIAQAIKQDIPGPIVVAESANILSIIGHEIVITGAMIYWVLAMVIEEKYDQATGPLAAGLTVFQGIIGGRWIGGAGLNVARAFGPAMVLGDWTRHWVWWVGDMLGAAIFSAIFMTFFAPKEKLWTKRWFCGKEERKGGDIEATSRM